MEWLQQAHKDGKLRSPYTPMETANLFLSDFDDIARKAHTL